jgi:hypothetical protein
MMGRDRRKHVLINFNNYKKRDDRDRQNFITQDNYKGYLNRIRDEPRAIRMKKNLLYVIHIHHKKKILLVL